MELKHIKASELVEFAEKAAASPHGTLAITTLRAMSQLVNPSVLPDDILLVVALDEQGKVMGYIGLLPAKAPSGGDRIFWNTCWWADEKAGAMVSLSLFSEYLKLAKHRVAFSHMSEQSAKVISQLGGFVTEQRAGGIIRFRNAMDERVKKSRKDNLILKTVKATSVLRLFDSLSNLLLRSDIKKYLLQNSDTGEVVWHDKILPQHSDFIKDHSGSMITKVNKELFEWWTGNPWLAYPNEANRELEKRYYFSSLAKTNQTRLLEVRSDEKTIGIAICTVIDGVVKTHYLYYMEAKKDLFFTALFKAILQEKRHHTLISFHPGFIRFLSSSSLPLISFTHKTRYTGYSQTLAEELGGYSFQDGDGDYVFT